MKIRWLKTSKFNYCSNWLLMWLQFPIDYSLSEIFPTDLPLDLDIFEKYVTWTLQIYQNVIDADIKQAQVSFIGKVSEDLYNIINAMLALIFLLFGWNRKYLMF